VHCDVYVCMCMYVCTYDVCMYVRVNVERINSIRFLDGENAIKKRYYFEWIERYTNPFRER
jgi:hypothetical protein